jgi:hypothetical protein
MRGQIASDVSNRERRAFERALDRLQPVGLAARLPQHGQLVLAQLVLIQHGIPEPLSGRAEAAVRRGAVAYRREARHREEPGLPLPLAVSALAIDFVDRAVL